VIAHVGLAGRGEDREGQLLGLLEAGGQVDAADGAGVLVVLPAGADHVATHHGLDGQRGQALDHQRAAAHLVALVGGHHGFGVDAGELVGDDVAELGEPEVGHGHQHATLARNRIREDDVEGRQAVGGDDEQRVGIDGVDVAHLAAAQQGAGSGWKSRKWASPRWGLGLLAKPGL
jgi:hypothetical protein